MGWRARGTVLSVRSAPDLGMHAFVLWRDYLCTNAERKNRIMLSML